MNKTRIEYCHYSWNPITGCRHDCPYCYARRLSRRYGRGFDPAFHHDRLEQAAKKRAPSIVFACDMGDINSPGVSLPDKLAVFDAAAKARQHQFLFLTKEARGYLDLPLVSFPDNCWFGASLTGESAGRDKINYEALRDLKTDKVYLQFEPLLGAASVGLDLRHFKWVIIGRATRFSAPFDRLWVEHILACARVVDVPVFVKDNVKLGRKIREFPPELDKLAGDLK